MYSDPKLEQKITEHEGIRKYAYLDTAGKTTVGIGRNLSQGGEGLSVDECFYLLRNDINRIYRALTLYEWFKRLSDVRQGVIIEIAFNIGIDGLLRFKNMIIALASNQYGSAAKEFLDSKLISYLYNKPLKDCISNSKLRFDFYLPDYNICIEFDGKQHFFHAEKFDSEGNDSLEKRQARDIVKNEYCACKKIKMIRIRYSQSSLIAAILTEHCL